MSYLRPPDGRGRLGEARGVSQRGEAPIDTNPRRSQNRQSSREAPYKEGLLTEWRFLLQGYKRRADRDIDALNNKKKARSDLIAQINFSRAMFGDGVE
jgi:hypothetical protein